MFEELLGSWIRENGNISVIASGMIGSRQGWIEAPYLDCPIGPDELAGHLTYTDQKGVMENPGFLDYRIPVASDLPMIETIIVEVPNPKHSYGVRGVGEVGIVPPLPAVANAIHDAVGVRLREAPMSPVKVLKALNQKNEANG